MPILAPQNDAILGPFAGLLGVDLTLVRWAEFVTEGDRIELATPSLGRLRWRVWHKDSGPVLVDNHDPEYPLARDLLEPKCRTLITDDPAIFAIARGSGTIPANKAAFRAVFIPSRGKILPTPEHVESALAPVSLSDSAPCIILSSSKTFVERMRHYSSSLMVEPLILPASALASFRALGNFDTFAEHMDNPSYILGILSAAVPLKRAAERATETEPISPVRDPRPAIPYLAGARNIFAAAISAEMRGAGAYFRQGGDHVEVVGDEIRQLTRDAMPTRFEKVARVIDAFGGPVDLNRDQAALITASDAFALPPIKVVTSWPYLKSDGGKLKACTSYDPETGIFPRGECPDIPLADAVAMLRDLLSEFHFPSPADEARAFAAMITPALCNSNLIHGGRVPITIVEANDSQAGKGLITKICSALYGQQVATYQKHSGKGLGGTKESFDNHVLAGRPFISMDNVRGKIDEDYLESFLTEDRYDARRMRENPISIDPSRYCLFVTSNQAEMTSDLANRCNIIKIQKAPAGTRFRRSPEELLRLIRSQQARYFGAIAALMREWISQGSPTSGLITRDANFAQWGKAADWICTHLLGCQSSIDAGFQESKARLSDSKFVDFRRMLLAAQRQGCQTGAFTTSALFAVLLDDGEIKIGKEYPSERNRQDMLAGIGRWLAPVFRRYGEEITVDGITIRRDLAPDGSKIYIIQFPEPAAPAPAPVPLPSSFSPQPSAFDSAAPLAPPSAAAADAPASPPAGPVAHFELTGHWDDDPDPPPKRPPPWQPPPDGWPPGTDPSDVF